jgi:2-polyprenyl-6-hydroxyphenyl methylase / 3-demethylubiquinone-9 3-methyltransferase
MKSVNADPAEVEKFDRLAEDWWNPEGPFKTLHQINPLRLNYIQNLSPLAGLKAADIGCGGGLLAEAMAQSGAQVTAIDLAESAIRIAAEHARASGLKVDYRVLPVEDLAAEMPATFDVVSCMEMLEHVPDPVSIVAACAALCKPGGHVYFSTLNRHPKAFAFAIVGAEYLLNLLPRGTHEYAKFIKPSELAAWARKCGLEVDNISGLQYNPVNGMHRLNDDPRVNYLMHLRKS